MFSKIKAVLIDLSGTIHIESNQIEGSIDALKRLKQSGLRYKFVTNTTKESLNVIYQRLTSIGFDVEKEQIFTSLIAAKDYIKSERLKPHLMLETEALEDFKNVITELEDNNNGEAVVVGLSPSHFNYDSMNVAFKKLLSGSRLVAIHQARYFKSSKGLLLGPGPFVKALAYAADLKPEEIVVVGKPERNFFMQALHTLDLSLYPEDAVMIGDDVRDDIGGAQAIGMKGILVKTGKYRPGDEKKIDSGPNLTLSSFSEAIDYILSQKNN